jgi:hypothetical protein
MWQERACDPEHRGAHDTVPTTVAPRRLANRREVVVVENSKVTKNTHRVCRRSLEKPKTQHEFIFAQKRLARLRRGSSSALRSDGLVGYDVSFTRRRSGVRTPVGLFFAFCDCLHCRECFLAVLLVSWLFKRDGVFLGPAVARSAQRHPRRGGAREKREERRAQPRRWESRGRT